MRYALDELFDAPATQPHPLPAKDFKGPLPLKANSYTLRQLRDGWLYVFDETAKELDEYEVKGSQFIHASKGSKGHLLYPANHKVAMAFSHQRWTERLKKEYCEQNSLRSKGMRSFNLLSLASKMGGEHDYHGAYQQYRYAAQQGNRMAQYRMGMMREKGLGAPRNNQHAYAWFSLAATEGMDEAIQARETLEGMMTPEEVKRAQKLSEYWFTQQQKI